MTSAFSGSSRPSPDKTRSKAFSHFDGSCPAANQNLPDLLPVDRQKIRYARPEGSEFPTGRSGPATAGYTAVKAQALTDRPTADS
jgi:hypothetical protein